MRFEETFPGRRHEYKKFCECCGQKHIIMSDDGDYADNEVIIYVECCCGNWIQFELPDL